jgi:hypothetical protein
MPPVTGPSRLLRSLAGTLAPAPGTGAGADPLATRDRAAGWLRDAGLIPEGAGLSGSEHSALLRLREALHDVLAARATGHRDPAAAERLTRALADGRLVVTITEDGSVKLRSSARSVYPGAVAAIAIAVAEAAAAGTF